MANDEASRRLEGVRHGREQSTAVMFFGTLEVAWLAARDVVDWPSGLAQGLHTKGRQRKHFAVALEEVRCRAPAAAAAL